MVIIPNVTCVARSLRVKPTETVRNGSASSTGSGVPRDDSSTGISSTVFKSKLKEVLNVSNSIQSAATVVLSTRIGTVRHRVPNVVLTEPSRTIQRTGIVYIWTEVHNSQLVASTGRLRFVWRILFRLLMASVVGKRPSQGSSFLKLPGPLSSLAARVAVHPTRLVDREASVPAGTVPMRRLSFSPDGPAGSVALWLQLFVGSASIRRRETLLLCRRTVQRRGDNQRISLKRSGNLASAALLLSRLPGALAV
mmetsp:Transcript_43620/g.115232  ORF Transcript_43620/g.115232 Transcript_43620/m.115232 type:complete len:252 (-) Transcript_43620:71-826(-)